MSDAFNIEPLTRATPAKLVKSKDSSKDRQNHDENRSKNESETDIIDEVDIPTEDNSTKDNYAKVNSVADKKKVSTHFDGFA